MRRFATTLAVLAAMAAAFAAVAPSALAAFGLHGLDVTFTEEDGAPATQAGSHPYEMTTTLRVNSRVVPEGGRCTVPSCEVPEGEPRDLTVELPPGFIGNPLATPRCTSEEFSELNTELIIPHCPNSSAIGIVGVKAEFDPFPTGNETLFYFPVYNLVPPPGVAAKFGFIVLGVPVTIESGVNEAPPYHLQARLTRISQALIFYGSELTLWGNPAAEVHDALRGSCLDARGPLGTLTGEPVSLGNCPVAIPEVPFLTLPRSCQGPLTTTFSADSWQEPGAFFTGSTTTHDGLEPPNPQGMTGCAKLGFGPEIEAQPTASQAESAAGLQFSLNVKNPGLTSPTGISQSDVKKVEVTLPEGMTVNPSSAEGLGVCTPAQYAAAGVGNPGCPESAKLGTVTVHTPLLEEPLEGSLYVAQPDDPEASGQENPFNSLIALYIVIRSPQYGVSLKLAGKVEPDPKTGQLVTTFDEAPQLPFSSFALHFREGPRSPLVTPPGCGTYSTRVKLTPWANPESPIETVSSFTVSAGVGGGPCPSGTPAFRPGFEAGAESNAAGSYSPFYMRLTRNDGEQDMTRFDSVLPPGELAKIAGVARCSDAAIEAARTRTGRAELAAPSCPASSQIGRVLAGAGVGPALTWVPGKIYLAGPFGGDPLSIVAIVPAVAGPFDAGTVVTREALNLNPVTYLAEVDGAASEPIPHILKGIPLKLRDLRVYVDRPNFTLNPTSCDEEQAKATLFGGGADVFSSADDVPVGLTSRYQAASCQSLGFKPELKLALKGGTRRAQHPALHSTLVPRAGDANIGQAVVTLPRTEFIDNAHINNPCTRVQFNANECPKNSILGKARAYSPLLDEPLEGPVYFRANGSERNLPDVVADLRGQFHIVLVGFVKTVTPKTNPRLQTTFASVPDAPVTRFTLNLFGGKKGLLVNNSNLCAHKLHAGLELTGQNHKIHDTTPVVATSCGKGRK